MVFARAGEDKEDSPSYYGFTRRSGWFIISSDRFGWFRRQRTLDPDCWLFADSIDVRNCRTNALITASPNAVHYKLFAKGQTVKLFMPLWTLNELIYVFRNIIKAARPGDSDETSSAVPIVFTSTDPAAGWKKFLKERENCKNPFERVLPPLIDKGSYELGKEAKAGALTEDKIILRFFVRGGVPRTVYSLGTLPDMWEFILSSNRLTGQVLEKLYRDADDASATFSMKQDDAEHRAFTYVIERTDDPLKNYDWLKETMFKAISEYARFLLGEKFKQRSLFDDFLALPKNDVGQRQGDAAVFERLCHKYLAGRGSVTYFAYERSLTDQPMVVPENEGEEVARVLELPLMSGPEVLFGIGTDGLKPDPQNPGFAYCRPLSMRYEGLDALYRPGVIFQMTISKQRPSSCDNGIMNQLQLAVTEWWGAPADGKKYHVCYVVPETNFASFTLQKGRLWDLITDPNVPCPDSCANQKKGCGCRFVKYFEFHVLGIPWFCKLDLDTFPISKDASIFRMYRDASIFKAGVSVSDHWKTRDAGMQQGITVSEAGGEQLNGRAIIEEIAHLKRTIADDRTKSSEEQLRMMALIQENAQLKRAMADKELEFLRLKEAEDVGPDERKKKRRS